MTLPVKGTVEFDELVAAVISRDKMRLNKLAVKLNIKREDLKDYVIGELWQLGETRGDDSDIRATVLEAVGTVPRADFDFEIASGHGDPEEAILLLSDLHGGGRTRSFNSRILCEELERMVNGLLKITYLHRSAYPINVLHIFSNGDQLQGEAVGRQGSLKDFEFGVAEQLVFMSTLLGDMTSRLLRHFKKIIWHVVPGNHTNVSKVSDVNWDIILGQLLEARFKEEPRVDFYIAEEFYLKAEVMGTEFLNIHGDQIQMYQQLPFYGLATKALRWKTSLEEMREVADIPYKVSFDVLTCGHFHVANFLVFNDVVMLIGGTAKTDDDFPLEKMGLKATVVQPFFGVHPRKGITWWYRLRLLP